MGLSGLHAFVIWMISSFSLPTFDEHLSRLSSVLECLRNANFTLNHKKSHFGEIELQVLGRIVNSEGVKTDPAKLEAVMNFPVPRTVKDLQSF